MTSLTAKEVDIKFEEAVVFIHATTLEEIKIKPSAHIKLRSDASEVICQVVATSSLVPPGTVGMSQDLLDRLAIKEGRKVTIYARRRPNSLEFLKSKREGAIWHEREIRTIVNDICNGVYTDLEIAMFTLAQYYLGLNMDEITTLTQAMAEYGTTLKFDEPVFDKHSIGGVPGNKVSLIIVPTVAAAGLLIPKTSSRAITSPSGTADTMEVLTNVNFSADEILEIAPKVRGMLVWGGTLDLSPLDEIVIHRIEQPLGIDPHSQMLASIFSKKISTGVDYLVLDVPTGEGTKMPTREEAIKYAQDATELGRRLGIQVEAALSYGEQPLGRAVGPALEAREALLTIMGKGPTSVLEKSVELAGILFEMAGLSPTGQGHVLALEYIQKGKTKAKMEEIIGVQGGDPNVKPEDIPVGEYSVNITAPKDGYIVKISNVAIKKICNAAGTPSHKQAGVYLHKKIGEFSKKGDKLMTIYSDSETRLTEAMNLAMNMSPFLLEGMILKRISSGPKTSRREQLIK